MARKHIGILTGGGDVPGLNSVIKEVVYRASEIDCTVIGVRRGMECIRSRKDPNATVEMGQSTNVTLCMATEALRTGRRIRFDASRRAFES